MLGRKIRRLWWVGSGPMLQISNKYTIYTQETDYSTTVQKKFTKRLKGFSMLHYCERLNKLEAETLENEAIEARFGNVL